jgi:hypothetical protein
MSRNEELASAVRSVLVAERERRKQEARSAPMSMRG